MKGSSVNEPMLEMYVFEAGQLLSRLEQILVKTEELSDLDSVVNEIFRVMHTIKGNSMMMLFEDIGVLAHAVEDLFDWVRKTPDQVSNFSAMVDLVLESVDFMKQEMDKIESGNAPDGKSTELVETIHAYLDSLKFMNPELEKEPTPPTVRNQKYYIAPASPGAEAPVAAAVLESTAWQAKLFFEDGCEMENVRAFSVVHNLKGFADKITHVPKDIVESDATVDEIRRDGFSIFFETAEPEPKLREFFEGVAFVREFHLESSAPADVQEAAAAVGGRKEIKVPRKEKDKEGETEAPATISKGMGNYISVGIGKVDQLMDLIGELVVSESMVVNNPDLKGLELDNFEKSVRQHRMIIKELQDVIMSIRMVPLELTFQKMQRIVRDMTRKLEKDVKLDIFGADTEVDKTVIEQIGDPLMHIIRNSIDHGIESAEERELLGKEPQGTVRLEARQAAGYVYIHIRDDGKGIDPETVLDKAERQGMLTRPRKEYTDREACNLIFTPGFSTKEAVTEFSGRGVGLDVVTQNIETIGGSVHVESEPGKGSEFIFKIPLTLAIVEAMLLRVGRSTFALPITGIKESLRVTVKDLIRDTEGNEMILIRGNAYPIVRLHEEFNLETEVKSVEDGILVLIESDDNMVLLFADAILGEQQLVVKPLSKVLTRVHGLGGCALLGDGRICLILDPAAMIHMERGGLNERGA